MATEKELLQCFGVCFTRLDRLDHVLLRASDASERAPTSLHAERFRRIQAARAGVNLDLGVLNRAWDQHAEELMDLAFGKKRKRPKPKADEEER